MKRLAWIALWLLGAGTGAALAQGRSVSYSTWIISGNMVTLRFLLPVTEAQRLMGVEVPVLTTGKLADYLLEHETVGSVGGDCPAIDQGFDLGRVDPLAVGPDLYGFEIFYRCRDPRQLVLHNGALFGQVPDHINFARIQKPGWSVEQLFTAQRQTLALPDDGAVAATAFATYVRLGLTHVLKNADRWIFLLGALLLVRRRRDVGYLIMALGAGYLCALLVAATGWVVPRVSRVEAFMGLLVMLLGAAIVQRALQSQRDAAARWPAIALLPVLAIGLVHAPGAAYALLGGAALCAGFLTLARWFEGRQIFWPGLIAMFTFLDGFAVPAVLGPAQWPQRAKLRMLVGFDLGAIMTAIVVIAVLTGAWLLVRARRFVALRALVDDLCAASLCGLGTFWLLTRLG